MESKTTEVIDKSLFWWSSQNWNSCIRPKHQHNVRGVAVDCKTRLDIR